MFLGLATVLIAKEFIYICLKMVIFCNFSKFFVVVKWNVLGKNGYPICVQRFKKDM